MNPAPTLSPQIVPILLSIGILLHIFIAVGVFNSASEHGMSAVGWTLFYLVTGPVGWLIFFIVRGLGTLGGSSMRAASRNRLRVIDQRGWDNLYETMLRVTPLPSKNFSDDVLTDMVNRGNWLGARKHSEDMRSIALNDGNRRLAEDYRRVLRWINSKRNPFMKKK